MSMFYELMMRKKEETLYPVIKGSLTESPEGVFSGFSANNYLEINNTVISNANFEVKINFKTGNTSNLQTIFENYTDNANNLEIFVNSGKLCSSVKVNGTYIAVTATGSANVLANTQYTCFLQFTGTKYIFSYLNDNVKTIIWEVDSTTNIFTTKDSFGNNNDKNRTFTGSIDLNNSYIKLGSTKYNLQAVVGYTVVGSPTIVDGVVSGFSSANYLQTSSSYTTNNMNNDNYEFCIKLTPASSMGSECYAIKYYNGSTVKGLGINNNKLAWAVGYPTTSGHKGTILSSFTVTTNTTYWLKGIYKNKIASLYYSLDGTNYTLIESIDETDQTFKITSAFNFGATVGSSYGLFQGSIDMKETYIKINNKLWFNGQQA